MKKNSHTRRALLGGLISLFIILLRSVLLGELSGYEAKILIQNHYQVLIHFAIQ